MHDGIALTALSTMHFVLEFAGSAVKGASGTQELTSVRRGRLLGVLSPRFT